MTVQHIVMLEFNDGVDEETRMNSLKAVEALKDKIDGIEKIESGKDFSGRAGALPIAVELFRVHCRQQVVHPP